MPPKGTKRARSASVIEKATRKLRSDGPVSPIPPLDSKKTVPESKASLGKSTAKPKPKLTLKGPRTPEKLKTGSKKPAKSGGKKESSPEKPKPTPKKPGKKDPKAETKKPAPKMADSTLKKDHKAEKKHATTSVAGDSTSKKKSKAEKKSTKEGGSSASKKRSSTGSEGGDRSKKQKLSPTASTPEKPGPPKPSPKKEARQLGPLLKKDGWRSQMMSANINDNRPMNSWPVLPRDKSRTLINPGNFCYRIATIQALVHIPAFYRYMSKTHRNCDKLSDSCVVCALQALTYFYWNDRSNASAVRTAMEELNTACLKNLPIPETEKQELPLREEFINGDQSDAVEFLHYLMSHVRDTELPTDEITFAEVFDLPAEDHWTCEGCSAEHIKDLPSDEVYTYSSLDLNTMTGEDMPLTEFLSRELVFQRGLHCVESRSCEIADAINIRQEPNGPVRECKIKFTAKPQVLMLRLKMFTVPEDPEGNGIYTADSNGRLQELKVFNEVDFKEYLDLSEYTLDNSSLVYRLDSVVAHRGETPSSGHYVAVLREIAPADTQHTFVTINDHHSMTYSGDYGFQDMQMPTDKEERPCEPYILIYSRMES